MALKWRGGDGGAVHGRRVEMVAFKNAGHAVMVWL